MGKEEGEGKGEGLVSFFFFLNKLIERYVLSLLRLLSSCQILLKHFVLNQQKIFGIKKKSYLCLALSLSFVALQHPHHDCYAYFFSFPLCFKGNINIDFTTLTYLLQKGCVFKSEDLIFAHFFLTRNQTQ